MITKSAWEKGCFEIDDPIFGPVQLNENFPLEWQLTELIADEACACCGLENDCRLCEFFEYSLLYQLISDVSENEEVAGMKGEQYE